MSVIPYLPASIVSLLAGGIIWWAYGRYRSRIARGVVAFLAVLLSYFLYFVLGLIMISMTLTDKELVHEASASLAYGTKPLGMMLLVVCALVMSIRGRAPGTNRDAL